MLLWTEGGREYEVPFGRTPEGSRGLAASGPSIDDIDMLDFVEGVGKSLERPMEDAMVESRARGGG